ncbi:OLC1v1027441C1 [Oldenlandia corymbosa var. corymbosa]|uniref:OLC1v1027441C1 n=1 Tax=Oldenlandia corymbosa var. corymbosa TaxID=529605 RepID=A0AAV1C9H5_OLDCO|nr:OLC1v1027441C1 [Oldenlandia corymbosa var. corymbosa]
MDSINGHDSAASPGKPEGIPDEHSGQTLDNVSVRSELESLRAAYLALQSECTRKEESLSQMIREKEEALKQNSDLLDAIKDVSRLQARSLEREGVLLREKEEIKRELGDSREIVEVLLKEKSEQSREFSQCLDAVKVIKQGMAKVISSISEEGEENQIVESEGGGEDLKVELKGISELVNRVRLKLDEFKEKGDKQRRELEQGLVSLTEENRDINDLLRIALVEKDTVERSLSKLRGNNEQKRGVILQIAERGLQRVGFSFGFMLGTGADELSSETSATASAASNSDGSDFDEEAVSLASTVEKIMKNMRLEVTQLRRSLDESRSEIERLKSLRELQTHKIEESTLYIKELEERVRMLTHKVEELQIEIRGAEKEVVRWRNACELEVQAGKNVSEEHEKVINILKQELEKLRAALQASNSKMKLKDELVASAIAAREAAERSLQLADSRSAGLCERIEELTRQFEEAEKRERANRRMIKRICWPWRTLKFHATQTNMVLVGI